MDFGLTGIQTWLELDDHRLGLACPCLFLALAQFRALFLSPSTCLDILCLTCEQALFLTSFFSFPTLFSSLTFCILYALPLRLITPFTPTTTSTTAFYILVTMSTSTLIPHLRQASQKVLPKISSLPSTLLLSKTTSPILISRRALTSTALKGLSVVPGVNPLRQYSTPSLAIQNEKTNVNQGMAFLFSFS